MRRSSPFTDFPFDRGLVEVLYGIIEILKESAFNSGLEETLEVILPDISRESETVIFAFVLSRRLAIVMLENEMT